MNNLTSQSRFSVKSLIYFGVILALYLVWIVFFMGFRPDHTSFILAVIVFYFATQGTHKFLVGALGLIFWWILLDSVRVFPSYEFNPVHIEDLYNHELNLFGIETERGRITPNHYLQAYKSTFLDFITGFTYLMWTPAPFALATYFYFTSRKNMINFGWAIFMTNIIGVSIYYLYPAAPPWYVDMYGFEANYHVSGSAAGLLDFDRIVGIDIFRGIYEKSFNVFGAIPSLHSAYPVIATYYAWKKGLKIGTIILGFFTLLTWFSAIYSIHHYVIDVILGIFCAIFALLIFENLISKTKLRNIVNNLAAYIS